MWKSGISYYNDSVQMTNLYKNYLNQDIYSVTFDYNKYDMIRFYDAEGEAVTVNIDVGDDGTGYYPTSSQSSNTWSVGTFNPDVRTIYFTNNNNWSDVRAYLWKSGTTQDNLWHGAAMSYVCNNSYGEGIYSITLDYKEYDSVVFNDMNSNEQTVDISIGDNGTGYYLNGLKSGSKYIVSTYQYQ